jgi:hypothetical protein
MTCYRNLYSMCACLELPAAPTLEEIMPSSTTVGIQPSRSNQGKDQFEPWRGPISSLGGPQTDLHARRSRHHCTRWLWPSSACNTHPEICTSCRDEGIHSHTVQEVMRPTTTLTLEIKMSRSLFNPIDRRPQAGISKQNSGGTKKQ